MWQILWQRKKWFPKVLWNHTPNYHVCIAFCKKSIYGLPFVCLLIYDNGNWTRTLYMLKVLPHWAINTASFYIVFLRQGLTKLSWPDVNSFCSLDRPWIFYLPALWVVEIIRPVSPGFLKGSMACQSPITSTGILSDSSLTGEEMEFFTLFCFKAPLCVTV